MRLDLGTGLGNRLAGGFGNGLAGRLMDFFLFFSDRLTETAF
jgi:hypothetical protein